MKKLILCALAVGLHAQSVLPHLAMGGGWTTTIYVTNGGSAVSGGCWLSFLNDAGADFIPPGATSGSIAINLAPLASLKVVLGGTSTLFEGSAWLAAQPGVPSTGNCPSGVSMTAVFSYGVQSAAVLSTPSSSYFLIPFDNTGGLSTGVAITSTGQTTFLGGSQGTGIGIIAYDENGNAAPGSSASLQLPYQGHTAFVLSNELPAIGPIRGTLYIECEASCSALAIQSNGTAFTSLPAYALSAQPGGASAPPGGSSATPVINSVSPILAQASQTITIMGTGFGSQQPYNGSSTYIQISDLTAGWNAGYGGDSIWLNITSWIDTQITISGLTGSYGSSGYALNSGDQAQVQVWNAQTGAGPATYKLTIGPGNGSGTGTGPVINSFTADSSTVTAGQSTTLRWSVSNASDVSISGIGSVAVSGSTVVSPVTTTVYTLTATNPAGMQTATVTVQVQASSGNVTFVFTNKLLNSANISINGNPVGTISAQSTQQISVPSQPSMTVSFDVVPTETSGGHAIGDPMSGSYNTLNSPTGMIPLSITNYFSSSNEQYFVPVITNTSGTTLEMAVNYGLVTQNECDCVVTSGAPPTQIGYYFLGSNSNVTAFAANSNYTGNYRQASTNLGASVISGSGQLNLTFNVFP
jgi:hypothetical protein